MAMLHAADRLSGRRLVRSAYEGEEKLLSAGFDCRPAEECVAGHAYELSHVEEFVAATRQVFERVDETDVDPLASGETRQA